MSFVNQRASHVVHLEVDVACEVLEFEGHLSFVGVRYHIKGSRSRRSRRVVFVDAIERADQPIPAVDALGMAFVDDLGMEPNGVFHLIQHIDLAALGLGTERLNDPSDVVFQTPDDGVPFAFGIDVVQGVVIRVDLELGGGDYPVGRGVGRVGRVDVGGGGGEVEVKVEMVDGITPRWVGDGVVIDA